MYDDTEDVTEHVPVADVFASDLASIEEVGGGCLRFTFYAWQRSTAYKDRRREKVIVARIIMPSSAVTRAAQASILAADGLEGFIHGVTVDRRDGNGDLN